MDSRITIRSGDEADESDLLYLWDKAIAWMVARGQEQQWGTDPASGKPSSRKLAREWATSPGFRVAEIDGRSVGFSVIVDEPPAHVPSTSLKQTYLYFLISDRDYAGRGIGSELVRQAALEASAAGSEVLRVDCWAGAPTLVAWYERQGFVRSDTFAVDVRGEWHGQVFEMPL